MQNIRTRDVLLQGAFVIGLSAMVVGFIYNAYYNMQAQGITSGFGFLNRATGWDIGFSLFEFGIRDPYWWTLLLGFLNTLFVAGLAILLATLVGLVIAMMRISSSPVLNAVSLAYTEVIRNTPPILQVLAWYAVLSRLPPPRQAISIGSGIFLSARGIFVPAVGIPGWAMMLIFAIALTTSAILIYIAFGHRFVFTPVRRKIRHVALTIGLAALSCAIVVFLTRDPSMAFISIPELKGFNFRGGMSLPPELVTMLIATTIYGSAYAAEIIRGGFLSVPQGKIEAGKALGMSSWAIFARIQLPLTVRNVLPMLTNFYVWLSKATTLGIAIGFSDLFMVVASSINQSGQTIELIIILAVGFWIINGSIVFLMNRISSKLQLVP